MLELVNYTFADLNKIQIDWTNHCANSSSCLGFLAIYFRSGLSPLEIILRLLDGMFFRFWRSKYSFPLLFPTLSYFIFLFYFFFLSLGTWVAFLNSSSVAQLCRLNTNDALGPISSITSLPSSYKMLLPPSTATSKIFKNIFLSSVTDQHTTTFKALSIYRPFGLWFMTKKSLIRFFNFLKSYSDSQRSPWKMRKGWALNGTYRLPTTSSIEVASRTPISTISRTLCS